MNARARWCVNSAVPRCGRVLHRSCPHLWGMWTAVWIDRLVGADLRGTSIGVGPGVRAAARWRSSSPQFSTPQNPRSQADSGGRARVLPSSVPRVCTRHAEYSTRCPQELWETRLPGFRAGRSVPWYPQREGGYWPQVTTVQARIRPDRRPGTATPPPAWGRAAGRGSSFVEASRRRRPRAGVVRARPWKGAPAVD